jgi:transcription initiation factor IIE alpha subunit
MSEMKSLNCYSCGIHFSLPKAVDDLWRDNQKVFYCPNGHGQAYKNTEDKETKNLQQEIKELKEKLQAALDELAKQTKRADELMSELEIWRPQVAEKEAV